MTGRDLRFASALLRGERTRNLECNSEETSMEHTAEFPSFEFLLIFLTALLPPTLTFSGYFRRREETGGSRSLSPAKSLRQQ